MATAVSISANNSTLQQKKNDVEASRKQATVDAGSRILQGNPKT